MMTFGDQTVTFVKVTEDLNNRDRYNTPAQIRTETDVPKCRFRPLTAKERLDLGDKVTDPWKCTAPPAPAVLALEPADEIMYGDMTFQVIGLDRPFADVTSAHIFKVTILCERTET